jgi:hypothetical protein
MRRVRLHGVVTAAVLALAIPLASAGGAAAATASVWPSASALGLPSGASATQAATSLPSVSCGSSTQCVAVGAYSAASGTEPMALTATSGAWAAAGTIAPPTDAGVTASALTSVSCTAAGTCLAVGNDVKSGATDPILATEANSAWSGASELTGLPSGASGGALSGVSCLGGGNCAAVGSDTVGGASQPMAVTALSGAFGQGVQVALPSGGQSGSLTSVACTTPGNCVAVGSYIDSGQTQAMVATETGGSWGAAAEVPLPTGADATQHAVLNSISCPAGGSCTAVGSYLNGTGQTAAMVETPSGASPGQAAALALPAGATGSTLDSISCTNPTNCTATGSVLAGTVAPLGATESGGSWAAGTALPTPSGATASGSLSATTLAVACTAAESCDAVGTYPVAAGIGAMALDSHPSLTITSRTLPSGAIGSRYSGHIDIAGGTGGEVWSITGGSLPAGLSFNAATGVVSGVPTTDQTTTFSVAVHDNATPPDQATATLSITIGPATKPAKTTTKKSSGNGKKKSSKKKKGAKVGSVKILHGSQVHFTVQCIDQRHCDGRVAVVIVEHLRGKKVIAINSSTHRARGTHTHTIWLGSIHYALRSGRKGTHTIRLDRFGSRLLRAKHELLAGLALRPHTAKRATIEHKLKLHQPKPKKTHKKHAHKKQHKKPAHKKKHTS